MSCGWMAYVVEEARRNLSAKAPEAYEPSAFRRTILTRVAASRVAAMASNVNLDREVLCPTLRSPMDRLRILNHSGRYHWRCRGSVAPSDSHPRRSRSIGQAVQGVTVHSPGSVAEPCCRGVAATCDRRRARRKPSMGSPLERLGASDGTTARTAPSSGARPWPPPIRTSPHFQLVPHPRQAGTQRPTSATRCRSSPASRRRRRPPEPSRASRCTWRWSSTVPARCSVCPWRRPSAARAT